MLTSAPRCSPRTLRVTWPAAAPSGASNGLDGGGATGLLDLERVGAGDDDALGLVVRVREQRVAEDRTLGDELAAVDLDAP